MSVLKEVMPPLNFKSNVLKNGAKNGFLKLIQLQVKIKKYMHLIDSSL